MEKLRRKLIQRLENKGVKEIKGVQLQECLTFDLIKALRMRGEEVWSCHNKERKNNAR
jgi:ubiquitin C-terminal hydrolase